MRRLGAFRVLLVLVVVVSAAAGISDAIARFRGESGHCVFGLTDATVSVSVDGPGAEAKCRAVRTEKYNGRTWYVYANGVQPSGAVICQVAYQGDTIVVRDQGVVNGKEICRATIDLANGPAASP